MDQTGSSRSHWRKKVMKISLWILGTIIFLAVVAFTAFKVSPWPSVLLIREFFKDEAVKAEIALTKHVPAGISVLLNEHYDSGDDAYLDVYYRSEIENTDRELPTVVWIHGGGWVAQSKDQMSSYSKILASRGFTVVAVEYSLAPGVTYPTQLKQIYAALAYLKENAQRLHVDFSNLFLAGDSAGSHIVAQVSNILSVPSYAGSVSIVPSIARSDLRGVILHCGPYNTDIAGEGPFGSFTNTVFWSYMGTKDFRADPRFKYTSVINYITREFPPMFVSVGNDDPLEEQSFLFARKAASLGVYVDSLFFPDNYVPALPHEYQFNLDTEAGKLALERCVKFLADMQKD